MRERAEADRAGDDGGKVGAAAPSTVVRRRAGGWIILSFGVVLLLLSALFVGLPPVSEDDGVDCGDDAALILALRPGTATTPTCRDLALEDTVIGGALVALGVAMVVWGWLRRRSPDEDGEASEPEVAPQVPPPQEVLRIPELRETGLRGDRLAVHPCTNVGLLLSTAAVGPFALLQLARTLPPVDAEVTGLVWLLWEGWVLAYLALVFGAASLLWWEAVAQLVRHPVLVLDRHGLASDDQPFVAWAEVTELTFGTGRTEDDEELAVLELRLRPDDDRPTSRTMRYDLEGLTAEPEEIAALARSLHRRSSGPAPAEPAPEPGDVRPVGRIAAVLVAATGLAVASTWLGLDVAGGWPLVLDF